MKKYPSIEQFRNLIKEVRMAHDYKGKNEEGNPIYLNTEKYPVLKFTGTIKLHGTNSSIVKYKEGNVEFQSRERVLSIDQDNANFMQEMVKKDLSFLFKDFEFNEYVAIYGEWCGGNIQKGVAINGLDKMFVIFGVKIDDNWVNIPVTLHDNVKGIFNILQFRTYHIDIDFNNPQLVQNEIIEMTKEVEDECPVGLYFGKKGIGEGLVFTCDTNKSYRFKSKGEKHSETKVKKLNSVNIEHLNSINEFIENTVTENRLEHGISFFKENNIELEPKNIGQYFSWIVKDVLKEEIDTITENDLNEKAIKNAIITKARVWYLNKINVLA